MSTTVTERKSQAGRAIERTEKLLRELKLPSDIVDTKDAIMQYISDIDCFPSTRATPSFSVIRTSRICSSSRLNAVERPRLGDGHR